MNLYLVFNNFIKKNSSIKATARNSHSLILQNALNQSRAQSIVHHLGQHILSLKNKI